MESSRGAESEMKRDALVAEPDELENPPEEEEVPKVTKPGWLVVIWLLIQDWYSDTRA